jgi:hypothetical protein
MNGPVMLLNQAHHLGAGGMNERASLQIETSKRGPPKRAPAYRQQPIERTISLTDSEREIARAIAEIKRLDELMTTLDTRIDDYDERLSDPDQDGWDVIDIQNNRDRVQGDAEHRPVSISCKRSIR